MTSHLFSFRKTATQNPRIQILSARLQKQRIRLDFPPQSRLITIYQVYWVSYLYLKSYNLQNKRFIED